MIIIIYSVCPIFTNPPDWWKALSNGVKTHLFKLKTPKISQAGAVPPPAPPPRSRSGLRPDRRGLKLWGKKMIPRRGGGGNDWNAQYIPLSTPPQRFKFAPKIFAALRAGWPWGKKMIGKWGGGKKMVLKTNIHPCWFVGRYEFELWVYIDFYSSDRFEVNLNSF